MDPLLTIVLPMFNRERQVCSTVLEVLEIASASALALSVEVVVVDDGSTDETYETTCELARSYPQVYALRQSIRQGFKAAIDLVARRMGREKVLAHDGISTIVASHLETAVVSLRQAQDHRSTGPRSHDAKTDIVGSRRFCTSRAQRLRYDPTRETTGGFCWMQMERPLIPRRRATPSMPSIALASNAQAIVSPDVSVSR